MDLPKFEVPDALKARVAWLLEREKTVGLTADESTELDSILKVEHLMRLLKTREGGRPDDEPPSDK